VAQPFDESVQPKSWLRKTLVKVVRKGAVPESTFAKVDQLVHQENGDYMEVFSMVGVPDGI
jgi:hypothetical protein